MTAILLSEDILNICFLPVNKITSQSRRGCGHEDAIFREMVGVYIVFISLCNFFIRAGE
jgi:hypothetical protein